MTPKTKFEKILFQYDSDELQKIAEELAFVRPNKDGLDLIEKMIMDLPVINTDATQQDYTLEPKNPA